MSVNLEALATIFLGLCIVRQYILIEIGDQFRIS